MLVEGTGATWRTVCEGINVVVGGKYMVLILVINSNILEEEWLNVGLDCKVGVLDDNSSIVGVTEYKGFPICTEDVVNIALEGKAVK